MICNLFVLEIDGEPVQTAGQPFAGAFEIRFLHAPDTEEEALLFLFGMAGLKQSNILGVEEALCELHDTAMNGSNLLKIYTDAAIKRDCQHKVIAGIRKVVVEIRKVRKIGLPCGRSLLQERITR